MDAIEYLIDKGYAENQGDIAVKAGLGPNLISRIKNGHVKAVSDDAIRALCSEFKDLNIEYFRGKSDFISRSDQVIQESQDLLDSNPPHEPRERSAPMTEHQPTANNYMADVIAAKNETIATQKETIATLQREVDMLRREIDRLKSSEFSLVVADNTEPDK